MSTCYQYGSTNLLQHIARIGVWFLHFFFGQKEGARGAPSPAEVINWWKVYSGSSWTQMPQLEPFGCGSPWITRSTRVGLLTWDMMGVTWCNMESVSVFHQKDLAEFSCLRKKKSDVHTGGINKSLMVCLKRRVLFWWHSPYSQHFAYGNQSSILLYPVVMRELRS